MMMPDRYDIPRLGVGALRAAPVVAGIATYAKTQSVLKAGAVSLISAVLATYLERRIKSSEIMNTLQSLGLPASGSRPINAEGWRRAVAALAGLR